MCRSAICASTELRESTACGALDRLIKAGLVEEYPQRVLWVPTGRNVKAYRAVGVEA
jgi:predicted transcriptional regulator